jgi:hypothetical protein
VRGQSDGFICDPTIIPTTITIISCLITVDTPLYVESSEPLTQTRFALLYTSHVSVSLSRFVFWIFETSVFVYSPTCVLTLLLDDEGIVYLLRM